MRQARYRHALLALPGGRFIAVGGLTDALGVVSSTEIYDPTTNAWTPAAPMATPRYGMAAHVLQDGRVLVAGGVNDFTEDQTAELYDPATNTWTATGSMLIPRALGASVVLPDGDVLVLGGETAVAVPLSLVERYDAQSGTWSVAGRLNHARYYHTATLLPDGTVLVAGGIGETRQPVAQAEIFDPVTGSTRAEAPMIEPRYYHSSVALADGRVLVAGGGVPDDCADPALLNGGPFRVLLLVECFKGTASAEIFTPATGSWTATSSLPENRWFTGIARLPSGKVVLCGGLSGSALARFTRLDSALVWDPSTGAWDPTPAMSASRESPALASLPGGSVLVSGGRTTDSQIFTAGVE